MERYFCVTKVSKLGAMAAAFCGHRRARLALFFWVLRCNGAKFWPTYDKYVEELVQINGAKYNLIKEYLQNTNMTEEQADGLSRRWLEVDESVVQLRLKYIPIFRKTLSAKGTALFFQLDRRVQMMIDLQLASALPIIEP
jgi:hypothetical protein